MAKTKGLRSVAKASFDVVTNGGLVAGILNKRKAQQVWPSIKRVSWKDEQLIGGMILKDVAIEGQEFADPAILAAREGTQHRYSKDELISLREVPLSKKKPDFINTECVPPSIWDPERWGDLKLKSATPTDGKGGNEVSLQPEGRRGRPGDPRERLRKENDGIVLSPQRRSFNTGCFVPMRGEPAHNGGRPTGGVGPNRAHSPIGGKGDNAHVGVRDAPPNVNRRIGSGRILRDSWDFNDKNDGGDNDYYRNQDDRRPFRREFDMSRDKDKQQRNNMGRYGNRRISDKDEEPEWFSGGPMSQNDTIELRGFDDIEKGNGGNKKKISSSQAKRVREWAKKKNSISEEKADEDQQPQQQQQPQQENGQKPQNQVDTKGEIESKNVQQDSKGARIDNNEKAQEHEQQNDNDKENRQGQNPSTTTGEIMNENSFIFDDLFKCDSIPGLLSNGVEGPADKTKSKFSRWFKRESPEKASESRRSSLHEEHLLKNLLNDINEPTSTVAVNIPQLGSSEAYFAPISPAAVNAGGAVGEPGNPKPAAGQVNIVDMFQRGKQVFGAKAAQQKNDMLNNIKTQFPGKVLSLNELESKMKKNLDISSAGQNQNKNMIKKDDDMAAFKRLLAQVSGGQVIPANGANHQKMPGMSLMEMLSHSQRQDEAQARLNSQKSHLIGGPAGPKAPTMMHTEFLLKMQQAQQEQQQRQQQHANMINKLMGLHAAPHIRSSPLQELAQQHSKELLSRPEAQAILQAMHQRIPSPRELQAHTQSILQRALIKKRLEEQQVNFLKKQEMQQSPNNSSSNKNVSSPPTPLAFTPTSVLRKMTADKEDAGRPIVKANVGYQSTAPEQFFNAHQQQFMFNQQQSRQQVVGGQQLGGGQYGQHQKSPQNTGVSSLGFIGQYSNQSNQQPQQFPQLTQQQLRAQHQQSLPVSTTTQPAQPQSSQQHQNTQSFPKQQQQQPPQQPQPQQQPKTAWQQFLSGAGTQQTGGRNNNLRKEDDSSNSCSSAINSSTNQLSRWFSSDLLERARVGELPSTAGLAEHAISLGEIERQSAAPVHN